MDRLTLMLLSCRFMNIYNKILQTDLHWSICIRPWTNSALLYIRIAHHRLHIQLQDLVHDFIITPGAYVVTVMLLCYLFFRVGIMQYIEIVPDNKWISQQNKQGRPRSNRSWTLPDKPMTPKITSDCMKPYASWLPSRNTTRSPWDLQWENCLARLRLLTTWFNGTLNFMRTTQLICQEILSPGLSPRMRFYVVSWIFLVAKPWLHIMPRPQCGRCLRSQLQITFNHWLRLGVRTQCFHLSGAQALWPSYPNLGRRVPMLVNSDQLLYLNLLVRSCLASLRSTLWNRLGRDWIVCHNLLIFQVEVVHQQFTDWHIIVTKFDFLQMTTSTLFTGRTLMHHNHNWAVESQWVWTCLKPLIWLIDVFFLQVFRILEYMMTSSTCWRLSTNILHSPSVTVVKQEHSGHFEVSDRAVRQLPLCGAALQHSFSLILLFRHPWSGLLTVSRCMQMIWWCTNTLKILTNCRRLSIMLDILWMFLKNVGWSLTWTNQKWCVDFLGLVPAKLKSALWNVPKLAIFSLFLDVIKNPLCWRLFLTSNTWELCFLTNSLSYWPRRSAFLQESVHRDNWPDGCIAKTCCLSHSRWKFGINASFPVWHTASCMLESLLPVWRYFNKSAWNSWEDFTKNLFLWPDNHMWTFSSSTSWQIQWNCSTRWQHGCGQKPSGSERPLMPRTFYADLNLIGFFNNSIPFNTFYTTPLQLWLPLLLLPIIVPFVTYILTLLKAFDAIALNNMETEQAHWDSAKTWTWLMVDPHVPDVKRLSQHGQPFGIMLSLSAHMIFLHRPRKTPMLNILRVAELLHFAATDNLQALSTNQDLCGYFMKRCGLCEKISLTSRGLFHHWRTEHHSEFLTSWSSTCAIVGAPHKALSMLTMWTSFPTTTPMCFSSTNCPSSNPESHEQFRWRSSCRDWSPLALHSLPQGLHHQVGSSDTPAALP